TTSIDKYRVYPVCFRNPENLPTASSAMTILRSHLGVEANAHGNTSVRINLRRDGASLASPPNVPRDTERRVARQPRVAYSFGSRTFRVPKGYTRCRRPEHLPQTSSRSPRPSSACC